VCRGRLGKVLVMFVSLSCGMVCMEWIVVLMCIILLVCRLVIWVVYCVLELLEKCVCMGFGCVCFLVVSLLVR